MRSVFPRGRQRVAWLTVLALWAPLVAGAQPSAPAAVANDPLSLRAAATLAADRYPGVLATAADREAASASIAVARQAYRPRVDGLFQLNRATHNNISGLLFPQGVIAPISGPPAPVNRASMVWGTALGALVTWEPFDFGARRAVVDAAVQGDQRATLMAEQSRLDAAAAAADAYLSVLAGAQTVRAAEAAVTRANTLLTVVKALVEADLRPGVDATTASAEQAAALMQAAQARRAVDVARATLAQFTGLAIDPVSLPAVPEQPQPTDVNSETTNGGVLLRPATGPLVREREAAQLEASARAAAARRSADPHVALQGTVYGRGTGIVDGVLSGTGADGLGLDAYNYAVGVTVTVPLTELANRGARTAIETARVKAAGARADEARRELARRLATAQRDLAAARELMALAPSVLEAARAAQAQATARYQAGLSSITDVADAQRRLSQAEIDTALVDLSAWRALVAVNALSAVDATQFLGTLPDRP